MRGSHIPEWSLEKRAGEWRSNRIADVVSIDGDILTVLRGNGRATVREIARLIGRSESATRERIRRLEGSGVILGYTAVIDEAKAGRPITALVHGRTEPSRLQQTTEAILRLQPVRNVMQLMGEGRLAVTLVARDTVELQSIIETDLALAGIRDMNAEIVTGNSLARKGTSVEGRELPSRGTASRELMWVSGHPGEAKC
ncbi:MAG TPA: Lrp/AsnC family transcriptional regulator [Thermoplasmata archaeon]|nr:Lrp/AsnC family transcriptional regulator [Thermoplasmata archaeon]